ncbi:MAG: NADH-quinone oxidoreductase subunit D [Actinomycetes bacterium]
MADVTYEEPYGDVLGDDAAAEDLYAGAYDTTEGRVYTLTGADWDSVLAPPEGEKERVVINMGPQHPSTHGVLRLILELEGETVTEARCGIGYLHTGIEKNLEYRTWTQAVAYVTRMDYLAPIANEAGYVHAVEKLLGIVDDIPERAQLVRIITLELNRIQSHLVCLATGGFEMGALTAMTNGFRDRELVLDLLEMITGLRMNHAFIRPGGVAQDIPEGGVAKIREVMRKLPNQLDGVPQLLVDNGIWKDRTSGVGYLDLAGCMALGVTGPVLRAAGLPYDVRKAQPYFGYEKFDFDVPTADSCDVYGRFLVRLEELNQSIRIVEQALDMLEPGPVMVADKKIAWPAQLSIGGDGMGNSLEHIRHIMGESMEALIHHFKIVTEGFHVPAGQVYSTIEAPRGELGVHIVSDGGTRPYRVHFRDPSFNNLQATAAMCEGGQVADVIGAVASIDPVMGGVDR